MFGNDVSNQNAATSGFAAVSVQLGNFCSGTLINSHVVLTARHCTCGFADVNPSFTVGLPQAGGFVSAVTRIIHHSTPFDICSAGHFIPGVQPSDFEVLTLATPVPTSLIPANAYPNLYLGDDPLGAANTYIDSAIPPPGQPFVHSFVQCGFGATDDQGNCGGGTRRCGAAPQPDADYLPSADAENGVTAPQGHGWVLDADAGTTNTPSDCTPIPDEAFATHSPGDSGGGLFVQPFDLSGAPLGRPLMVAVTQGITLVPGIDRDQDWSLIGNKDITDGSGQGLPPVRNADLVEQGINVDLDGDGVPDDVDNCPPALCPQNVADCFNPNQKDSDHDGYGDVCDPCPSTPDLPDLSKPGHPGMDADGDGIWDSCDNCPYTRNKSQQDSDGDGVGDACDLCPGVPSMGYQVCTSDAQCAGVFHADSGSTCVIGQARCIGLAPGFPIGHCDRVLNDDDDCDGLGNECDSCPTNPANGLLGIEANSNVDSESAVAVERRGDVCDEVPVFVSRPDVPANGVLDNGSIQFSASAGIGTENCSFDPVSGSSSCAPKTFPSAAGLNVGFRQCNCLQSLNASDPRTDCIINNCPISSKELARPNSHWAAVTVASGNGPDVLPNCTPGQPCSQPHFTNRIFSSALHDDDMAAHPGDGTNTADWFESWRIGNEETIFWRWQADANAGRVVSQPQPTGPFSPRTYGLFWSFVLPSQGTASTRDANTGGELRSNYSLVRTPLNGAIETAPQPVPFQPCPTFPCGLVLRPDLPRVNPDPTVIGNVFAAHKTPTRIIETASGPILTGGADVSGEDASALLSPEVAGMLASGQFAFLSPVEAGSPHIGSNNHTAVVAIPRDWTLSSVATPISFTFSNTFSSPPRRLSDVVDPPQFVFPSIREATPDDRTAPRALFTLTSNSVLLVGGRRGSDATHEVWRYDFGTDAWSGQTFSPPGVGDVMALALDAGSERLLVLDTDDPFVAKPQVRFVLIDLHARAGKLLCTRHHAQASERFTLTSRQDGSYILLDSSDGGSIRATRLRISSMSVLHATGHAEIPGRLLDEPVNTTTGVVAFVARTGRQELVTITDATFGESEADEESDICEDAGHSHPHGADAAGE